jgi:Autophagy protein Apg5
MSLGKEHTTQLWEAVEKGQHSLRYHLFRDTDGWRLVDVSLFQKSYQKLLHPTDRALLHIPIKIYLPSAAVDDGKGKIVQAGHLRVVQGLVAPTVSSRMYRAELYETSVIV